MILQPFKLLLIIYSLTSVTWNAFVSLTWSSPPRIISSLRLASPPSSLFPNLVFLRSAFLHSATWPATPTCVLSAWLPLKHSSVPVTLLMPLLLLMVILPTWLLHSSRWPIVLSVLVFPFNLMIRLASASLRLILPSVWLIPAWLVSCVLPECLARSSWLPASNSLACWVKNSSASRSATLALSITSVLLACVISAWLSFVLLVHSVFPVSLSLPPVLSLFFVSLWYPLLISLPLLSLSFLSLFLVPFLLSLFFLLFLLLSSSLLISPSLLFPPSFLSLLCFVPFLPLFFLLSHPVPLYLVSIILLIALSSLLISLLFVFLSAFLISSLSFLHSSIMMPLFPVSFVFAPTACFSTAPTRQSHRQPSSCKGK